jgi:hypothetical protein
MKNFIQNLKRLAYFLPYIFVFIASLYWPKDPDLGWHLKYGEYFFKHHQILRDNIFSTMMPDFHWANGSWGTDVLTYFIYNHWGFLGLTLASALIITLTFFSFSKAAKFTFFENALFFPILVFLESAMSSSSFRGQQISLLFLGILFYLLSCYKFFSKILFFIPILFLIWCNIHEESFLGIVLFGLWIGFGIVKNLFDSHTANKKVFYKETLFLVVIFVLSFLVTFINPFGVGIHLTALSHLGNPLLKNVSEYIPFSTFSASWFGLVIVTVLTLLGIIYLFLKKQIVNSLPILGIPFVLLLLSFFVRRYAWPGYYLALPIFLILLSDIKFYAKKYLYIIAVTISIISILLAIALKTPFDQFVNMFWETYCSVQTVPCSPQSARFIKSHNLSSNLFSYYDWGGWLIWNYPDVKPSVDGRMHVWKDSSGYSASVDFDAYMNAKKSIDQSSYDVIYLPMDRSPLYMELSELVSQNTWKLAYRDDNAVIIVRVKK